MFLYVFPVFYFKFKYNDKKETNMLLWRNDISYISINLSFQLKLFIILTKWKTNFQLSMISAKYNKINFSLKWMSSQPQ